jgi:hypothetical protein
LSLMQPASRLQIDGINTREDRISCFLSLARAYEELFSEKGSAQCGKRNFTNYWGECQTERSVMCVMTRERHFKNYYGCRKYIRHSIIFKRIKGRIIAFGEKLSSRRRDRLEYGRHNACLVIDVSRLTFNDAISRANYFAVPR